MWCNFFFEEERRLGLEQEARGAVWHLTTRRIVQAPIFEESVDVPGRSFKPSLAVASSTTVTSIDFNLSLGAASVQISDVRVALLCSRCSVAWLGLEAAAEASLRTLRGLPAAEQVRQM